MNKDLARIVNNYIYESEVNHLLLDWIRDNLILQFMSPMANAINFKDGILQLCNKYKLPCNIKLINEDQTRLNYEVKPKFEVGELNYHNTQFFVDFLRLCLRWCMRARQFEPIDVYDSNGSRDKNDEIKEYIKYKISTFNCLSEELGLKIRIIFRYVDHYDIAIVI